MTDDDWEGVEIKVRVAEVVKVRTRVRQDEDDGTWCAITMIGESPIFTRGRTRELARSRAAAAARGILLRVLEEQARAAS